MKEWKLQEFKVEKLSSWEKQKLETDKEYGGRISFRNDVSENFTVNIPPEVAEKVYELISGVVASAACELAERMNNALK